MNRDGFTLKVFHIPGEVVDAIQVHRLGGRTAESFVGRDLEASDYVVDGPRYAEVGLGCLWPIQMLLPITVDTLPHPESTVATGTY